MRRHDVRVRPRGLRPAVLAAACVAITVGAATAAPDPLRASRTCRNAIVKETQKLAKTALKLVDACHTKRDKGKLAADCNDLRAADPKGKLAKAEGKAAGRIAKKCPAGEPVLANFFDAAPAPAVVAAVHAAIEGSARALQGFPDLVGAKAAGKCHKAIGKARTKIVDEILKAAVKCQRKRDKRATVFGALDPTCVGEAVKQGPRARKTLGKKCTGIPGPDVGSCAGFPDCLVTHATATGQGLAAALYARASRPFAGRIAVTPDAAQAATETIGPDGGVVMATGADGTSYTLTVPPLALQATTDITLTPVAAIADLPLTGGTVAAVQFAPEGLQLSVPATLAITLPQAVDPAGLVGFDWAGAGAAFGLELVAVDGATLTLTVRHFSGAGVGASAPADLDAIVDAIFGPTPASLTTAFVALANDPNADLPGDFVALLTTYYDTAVAPALAGAAVSDAALLAALTEYVLWDGTIQKSALILGFELEAFLGLDGFALANRDAAAQPLLAAGLRAGIDRALADCLAQQSLVRAEEAFRWQVIAEALGLDSPANGLDLETLLAGFCVEIVFAEVSFPQAPLAGVPAALQVQAGYAFAGSPTLFTDQPMIYDIAASGTEEAFGFGTPPAGTPHQKSFTPTAGAPLTITVEARLALLDLINLALLVRGTAIIVRGDLTVEPYENVVVATGGAQQFEALLFGEPADGVTWSATGGTIDGDGLFTAGTVPGTFVVTAMLGGLVTEVPVRIDDLPTVELVSLHASARAGHLTFPFERVIETDLSAIPFELHASIADPTSGCTASQTLTLDLATAADGSVTITTTGGGTASASGFCGRTSLSIVFRIDEPFAYELIGTVASPVQFGEGHNATYHLLFFPSLNAVGITCDCTQGCGNSCPPEPEPIGTLAPGNYRLDTMTSREGSVALTLALTPVD